jgi:hypothetical protein
VANAGRVRCAGHTTHPLRLIIDAERVTVPAPCLFYVAPAGRAPRSRCPARTRRAGQRRPAREYPAEPAPTDFRPSMTRVPRAFVAKPIGRSCGPVNPLCGGFPVLGCGRLGMGLGAGLRRPGRADNGFGGAHQLVIDVPYCVIIRRGPVIMRPVRGRCVAVMAVTSFVVRGGVIAGSCPAYDLSQADRGETVMRLL